MMFDPSCSQPNNVQNQRMFKQPMNVKTPSDFGKSSNSKQRMSRPTTTLSTTTSKPASFIFGVNYAVSNQVLEVLDNKFDADQHNSGNGTLVLREETKNAKEAYPIDLHTELGEHSEELECTDHLDHQDTIEGGEGKRKHGSVKQPKTNHKKVKGLTKHRRRESGKRRGWLYYLKLLCSR